MNGAYQTIASSYVNAFPIAHLRYELSPKLIARAGFLQTIQSGSVDLGGQVVATGNPYLKPTTSNNFDLALEYGLPDAGVISVGLFDKEMRNDIIASTFRAPYPPSGSNSLLTRQSFNIQREFYGQTYEACFKAKL